MRKTIVDDKNDDCTIVTKGKNSFFTNSNLNCALVVICCVDQTDAAHRADSFLESARLTVMGGGLVNTLSAYTAFSEGL